MENYIDGTNIEIHTEGKITETHIEVTMYGGSYRGYNVWRLIEATMYVVSYRGYNVWRNI